MTVFIETFRRNLRIPRLLGFGNWEPKVDFIETRSIRLRRPSSVETPSFNEITLVLIGNHSFFLCDLVSFFFLTFLMVSRLFWREILKPKWFHEVQNKNKLKPLGGLSYFFFAFHEYHFGFQDFLAKIVVNTTKVKKNNEFQVTK